MCLVHTYPFHALDSSHVIEAGGDQLIILEENNLHWKCGHLSGGGEVTWWSMHEPLIYQTTTNLS